MADGNGMNGGWSGSAGGGWAPGKGRVTCWRNVGPSADVWGRRNADYRAEQRGGRLGGGGGRRGGRGGGETKAMSWEKLWPRSRELKADWQERQFAEAVTAKIAGIVNYLKSFETHCTVRIAKMEVQIERLERCVDQLEALTGCRPVEDVQLGNQSDDNQGKLYRLGFSLLAYFHSPLLAFVLFLSLLLPRSFVRPSLIQRVFQIGG